MEAITKNKLYEGMFLIDSTLAGSDWDGVNNTIKTILEKAEAEIVSIRKWDDRRLAYEIKGKGRGTYILCYFKAGGEKIKDIEKAVQLSEQIIRVLILSAERITAEDIEKETPATEAEKEKSPDAVIQDAEPKKEKTPDAVIQDAEAEKEKIPDAVIQDAEAEQQSTDEEAEKEEAKKPEDTEQAEVLEQDQEEIAEDEQESEPRE